MKRTGLIILMLVIVVTVTSAQFRSNNNPTSRQDKPASELPKFYFGGGGSLGFGTGYTYYALFPIVGYRVTDVFSVGTGITYQHYSYNYNSTSAAQGSYTQYGVTPFARYNINPLFIQTELDIINSPDYADNTSASYLTRKNFTRFLVGLGYMSQVGNGRSAFNILAMYDLLYKTPSVFSSPVVIRLFVTF